MIEYKQYVPEDKKDDETFVSQIRQNVAAELSRQASRADDPDEFYVEALSRIQYFPSRNGGFWISSTLDRDADAEYLDPGFVAPFKADVPFAKDSAPVVLTESEYREHMARKAAQR